LEFLFILEKQILVRIKLLAQRLRKFKSGFELFSQTCLWQTNQKNKRTQTSAHPKTRLPDECKQAKRQNPKLLSLYIMGVSTRKSNSKHRKTVKQQQNP
jgi:hypothetical protein